jgi:hypothetical protein
MDYCRICTQHYISRYTYKCEQLTIPYIVITSEINLHNLPLHHSHTSGYWSVKLLLQRYESPQKSSLHVKTLPRWDRWSLDQAIWSQHDQE